MLAIALFYKNHKNLFLNQTSQYPPICEDMGLLYTTDHCNHIDPSCPLNVGLMPHEILYDPMLL